MKKVTKWSEQVPGLGFCKAGRIEITAPDNGSVIISKQHGPEWVDLDDLTNEVGMYEGNINEALKLEYLPVHGFFPSGDNPENVTIKSVKDYIQVAPKFIKKADAPEVAPVSDDFKEAFESVASLGNEGIVRMLQSLGDAIFEIRSILLAMANKE